MIIVALLPVVFYIFGYSRIVLVYAGFAVQAAYMFYRGDQLGRLPIIGPHDTLYFLSFAIVLFALPMTSRMKDRHRHLFPMLLLSALFCSLSLFFPPHAGPLPPVLKTFWFESHVALSFFAYALFGIAAVLGGIFLVYTRNGGRDTAEGPLGAGVETLQYKAILVGYCLFSAAMVFGGIWAYYAWGTYWLWTPKELWTVILWLFYSLYLHARLRSWWAGKPSAVLGIVGFVIVLFTYLGVSLLMKSSHSF
jgi:cytochrome c-type biogenesis protein CcsB